jgi:hypothetical protein
MDSIFASKSTKTQAAINVISPAPQDVWQQLWTQDSYATVTQSPAWTAAICRSGWYQDTSRLYELANGRILVLPLVRQRPFAFLGSGSMPTHWGFGGLLSSQPISAEDVTAVWQDVRTLPLLHFRLRPNPLLAQAWKSGQPAFVHAIPRRAHVLNLTGGFANVWAKQFSSNTRRNVRKAEKAQLTVECDQNGRLIPTFYQLFQISVNRWAEQQHEPIWLAQWRARQRDPQSKFHQIAKALGSHFRLWLAWYQGEPAAAILVLQGHNAHYTRGVMNKSVAGATHANDLLHRLAIEDACAEGCNSYHMGETGNSASLSQFKKRFGARPVEYAEYFWERVPLKNADTFLRNRVKRLIGFQDA